MKVLYLSNIPSPYMVNFFNELGKECQLTVLFERNTSSERDKSWEQYEFRNFEGIVMHGINTAVDAAFCPQVVKYIKRNRYDFIFVTNPSTPTGIWAIEYLKLRRIPFILESEGGFAKDGKGLKEKFKKQLMSGALLYFSTTEMDDKYFLMYGAVKEKIVRYPFTSLYEKDLLAETTTQLKKIDMKHALGIKEEKMILLVGQFIYRKGNDIMLNACKNIDKNTAVYFIGGTPTQEYLKLKDELGLSHVHFVEFVSKQELKSYYIASDLFVLPTREDTWGLVINEAMAYGLPVITTHMCIAGLALVENNVNGFLVPVDDVEALTDRINEILTHDELRDKMAHRNLEKIQWYTYENMAKRHIELLSNMAAKGWVSHEK